MTRGIWGMHAGVVCSQHSAHKNMRKQGKILDRALRNMTQAPQVRTAYGARAEAHQNIQMSASRGQARTPTSPTFPHHTREPVACLLTHCACTCAHAEPCGGGGLLRVQRGAHRKPDPRGVQAVQH